jgi:D-3-phosphoglycerate dehydrogenase / 2-oxoglutarate reductase
MGDTELPVTIGSPIPGLVEGTPACGRGEAGSLGRVLIVDPIDRDAIDELARSFDVEVRLQPPQDELRELIRDADVLILRSGVTLGADVIEAANRLRIVARAGMGVDNIDLETARRAGIIVFNVPAESAHAVAEFTIGLALAAARKIALADAQVRTNKWSKDALMGVELNRQTIGVVGYGSVGAKVAELALAIGMHVLACVARPSAPRRAELDARRVELVDLDELIERSDVVCLAVPLSESTRGLISYEQLQRMKPTAYLVNICRAAVVNEDALVDALRGERIAGAALDVFGEERWPARLAKLDNVVLTPHIAAMTSTSQRRIGRIVVDSIAAALSGAPVENRLC